MSRSTFQPRSQANKKQTADTHRIHDEDYNDWTKANESGAKEETWRLPSKLFDAERINLEQIKETELS